MVYGNFYLFFEGMKAQFGMIWLMEKVYMLLNKGLSGLFLPFLIRVMLVIVQILLHWTYKLMCPSSPKTIQTFIY